MTLGHKCKMQRLYLFDGAECEEPVTEEEEMNAIEETYLEAEPVVTPEISLHAIAGASTP